MGGGFANYIDSIAFAYHRELLAKDVMAELGNEVEEEVAAAYVTVDMEGHLPLHLLPMSHHLVPL